MALRAQCKESGKPETQLNFPIRKCSDRTEERNALLLEVQTIAADGDGIKLETSNPQAQLKAFALMKKQLNFIRVQCDKISKKETFFQIKIPTLGSGYKDYK